MGKISLKRIFVYLLGIFIMAVGVSISINSGLGITPMSSFPYVLSEITGLSMTLCMTLAFSLYVTLQFILLGRESKPSILLQLLVALIFGFFTDTAGVFLKSFVFDNFIARIGLSLLGTIVLSLGLTMYMPMDLPVLPPEGLSATLDYKVEKIEFHHCKTLVDLASVLISVVLSLSFLGRLEAIGIGTIIGAVLVGQLIPVLKNVSAPIVDWALGDHEDVDDVDYTEKIMDDDIIK